MKHTILRLVAKAKDLLRLISLYQAGYDEGVKKGKDNARNRGN